MGIGTMKTFKIVDVTPVLENRNMEPTETVIVSGWAEVRKVNGSRTFESGQSGFNKFFEFKFRYKGNISLNANTKLVYRNQKYQIGDIERDKEKLFWWIVRCEIKSFN